jgi:NAD(P)-dependent dehydrogenase (short-subunit alcohol dehydrogenase family)
MSGAATDQGTTVTTTRTVLVTGASSGFGALTVRALADAGHSVWAGMRDVGGRNRQAAAEADAYASDHGVTLRPVEMDVLDQSSVDAAVATVVVGSGRIDVLVHNAGHMMLGPAEAFEPEQLAEVYDTNVLSTQRANRAVLPHLRAQRDGLVVWIGSSSTRGGTPPYLAPYFAAKAGMDALAVSYAAELARFGVDTSIVVPGSFTVGTNHFANAGHAGDDAVAAEYETEYAGLMGQVAERLAALAPDDQDPGEVARAVVDLVSTPKGRRPFRVHIDPADDGAETVYAVGDRVRREFYRRVGLEDLLAPRLA